MAAALQRPFPYTNRRVICNSPSTGTVYFDDAFFTGVFEVLKDEALFRRVYVELSAVTWPGGLDLAPDAMYDEIKRNGEWVLR